MLESNFSLFCLSDPRLEPDIFAKKCFYGRKNEMQSHTTTRMLAVSTVRVLSSAAARRLCEAFAFASSTVGTAATHAKEDRP